MKVHLNKILLVILFVTYTYACFSQQYIQVRLKNDFSIPIKSINGQIKNNKQELVNTYSLKFKDDQLTAIFKDFTITNFEKSYPSVSKVQHKYAEMLNRVYTVRVDKDLKSLYTKLKLAKSLDLEDVVYNYDPISLSPTNPSDYFAGYNIKNYPMGTTNLHLDYINAKKGWELTRGLECVTIGIVDSSFQHHADLDSKVLNLSSLSSSVLYPSNVETHGTKVAGDAAAITDNNYGMAGVGNKVTLRYYQWTYSGILQAAMDGCKVINCSWYSGFYPSTYDQAIIDVVHDTYGATIVAAAGNNNTGTPTAYFYPASYNHVISVTAISHRFPIASYNPPFQPYENWIDCHEKIVGIPSANHNDSVDICAPGYDVSVLIPSGYGNGLGSDWGTSLSSPLVAGAAALLYSLNPNFTPDQVEYYLKASANSSIYSISQNSSFLGKLGAGKLDVGAAALLASANACQPNFTDIVWKSGSTVINNNDYPTYIISNPTLSFSINPSSVTSGSTVEWEFISGNDVVTKTGTNVSITWGSDFSTMIGNYQRKDVVPLEVYVRQGTSCCYSAYYKEKGYSSLVPSGSSDGPYPPYNCNGNLFLANNGILSGNYKAANIYAGSKYGNSASLTQTTPYSIVTNFAAANEIRLSPGFKATALVGPGYGYFHALISSSCAIPTTGSFSNFTPPSQSKVETDSLETLEEKQPTLKIIRTYPNPAKNILNLDFQVNNIGIVNIVLVNSLGKQVANFTTNAPTNNTLLHEQIDMSKFSNGIYNVKIFNNKESISTTIIKSD